ERHLRPDFAKDIVTELLKVNPLARQLRQLGSDSEHQHQHQPDDEIVQTSTSSSSIRHRHRRDESDDKDNEEQSMDIETPDEALASGQRGLRLTLVKGTAVRVLTKTGGNEVTAVIVRGHQSVFNNNNLYPSIMIHFKNQPIPQ